MSQNAVWLPSDLPVERCSKWLIHGSTPDTHTHLQQLAVTCRGNMVMEMCVCSKKVAVSFHCALIIHVACGCLIEMNILLLLITAIARVMEHLAVTWVIKDAVPHVHTCESQRLCLRYETSTPEAD